MAGESPDRSKQRESSAEPTSGSAGSVPEARDPRLAVSREKDSSGGGADTATKILTVRSGAGDDTAMQAAVSSWVRAPHPDTAAKPSDAEAESEGSSEAGRGTRIPSNVKTEPKTSSDTDADADADASAAAKGEAEIPSAAKAGSEGSSDAKPEVEKPSDAKPEADGSPASKTEAAKGEADADVEPAVDEDAEGKPKADATAKSETDADAKPAGNSKPDADSRATKGTKTTKTATTEADAEGAEGKAGTEAEAEADADADATAVADDKAGTDAEDVAGGKADEGSAAAAGGKTSSGDRDVADDKTSTAGKHLAGGKGVAGEGEGVAEAVDGGDGPEAADGGDAPQGPPADDDESRTGGADGNTDAEGAAEANPAPTPAAPADKPPVDQPTAVFKAPRPKKAEVDQPTTMLKLGGKPKQPESDAERTSKFVALKDDLRKPAPQPAPQPAAQQPAARPAPDATTPVPQVGPERTTQQPLPPKPPLDLLAELTNTPPPPETPVRTLVRRVKIWSPLVLLLAVILAVVQAVRPLPSPTLALTGEETYTFDGGRTTLPWPGEGQGWIDADGVGTMGHFGKQTPVAIGSVAKTMTAYIILKHHPLKPGEEGPKIKVDAKAEKEGGYDKAGESTLNTVKAGSYLTEKQALSAVMIPSANNIARLLARWDAGSEAAFVKQMNATARELGMKNTTYTDPSGLKETTVSTAEDQVKLGRAFVKVPALVAISSAASWTDPSGHFWPNYNELPYRMGAIGIKTGSTTAAGGNLLFASRKQVGGRTVTLVGAILGQHKPKILETVNAVSKTALTAAQDALTSSKILKKGDVVGYVDDGLGGHTPVAVTQDVTAAGWAGMKVRLSFAPGTVPHTAKAGTRVGTLTVGDGTSGAVKVPVALQKDLAEPGFGAKLTRLG